MSRHHQRKQRTPIEEALLFTPGDLEDLRQVWALAVEQLQPDTRTPPRLADNNVDELGYPRRLGYGHAAITRDAGLRRERAERVVNARLGRPTPGYSPAPLRVAALEDLVAAEAVLIGIADDVTRHVRRNPTDHRPGPHRLLRHSSHVTVRHSDIDELGYSLRLGYGRHAISGRALNLVGARRDIDPAPAAIAWLLRALPAITDLQLAEKTAGAVRSARLIARGVVGLPDLQVRLEPACFVCQQPALRMNLDKRYVECRNPNCTPTPEQCGFTGPRGEPRWYQGEWSWLSQRLDVSLEDRFLQLLEQVAS